MVAARLGSAPGEHAWGDTGFVILRHVLKGDKKVYSLVMHLRREPLHPDRTAAPWLKRLLIGAMTEKEDGKKPRWRVTATLPTWKDEDKGNFSPANVQNDVKLEPGVYEEEEELTKDQRRYVKLKGKWIRAAGQQSDEGKVKELSPWADFDLETAAKAYQQFRLERAEEASIAVYTSRGALARQAQVGLFERTSHLRVGPAGFASEQSSTVPPWLRQTDDNGSFGLPQDEAIREIAIAHPDGYLEIRADELRKTRSVRLRQWASVEGVVRNGSIPVVNVPVSIQRKLPEAGDPRLLNLEFYNARTDKAGRLFRRVFLGERLQQIDAVEAKTEKDAVDGDAAHQAGTSATSARDEDADEQVADHGHAQ